MTGRLAAAALALLLAACDDNMARQPGVAFDDPAAVPRAPIPPGAVPRGALDRAAALAGPAAPLDAAALRRGQERYAIHCAPCHGIAGYGDGMVVRHGFPPPPSFHDEARRGIAMRRVVEVITSGQGLMFPYADWVEPADRWAIAGYVRALQISQGAPPELVPPEDRARLGRRP